MAVVSMKALLESGVHFGHRTNKWNPRMKPYIFTERNGIHIIDLQQTVKAMNRAYKIIRNVAAEGGLVMFVGTKRQAQETILAEATRCEMPYVTERWLGGMLTNWSTMSQRIQDMERMEQQVSGENASRITKKEALLIQRKIDRLQIRLSGVRNMKRIPDLIFIVDINREVAAVHEANLLNIPIVALVDTNCDPNPIDHVIPSNDDAIRAIKLLVGKVADAVLEGVAMQKDAQDERDAQSDPSQAALDKKPAPVIEMEEEISDDDLLGSATLAKLNVKDEAEGSDEKESDSESAEPVSEEAAEENVDQKEESVEEHAEKKPEEKEEGKKDTAEEPVEKVEKKEDVSDKKEPAKKTADKKKDEKVDEKAADKKKESTKTDEDKSE